MRKLLPYTPFLIILCITVLLFVKVTQSGRNNDSIHFDEIMVGKKIADMELETLTGQKLNMNSYIGKYTVVNLFASWCTSCLYEHPLISTLKGERGVQLIGIAWRDKKQDTSQWLKQNGNPYNEVALDEMGKYGILLGVTGIPETFLVDPQGVIVMHIRGTVMNEDLQAIISKIKLNK